MSPSLDLRINAEKRRAREGGTRLHLAFHSQILSKNVPQKRCQHSSLLGKLVIQGSHTEISRVSEKVAKDPKVPSLSGKAASLGTAGRNFPPP